MRAGLLWAFNSTIVFKPLDGNIGKLFCPRFLEKEKNCWYSGFSSKIYLQKCYRRIGYRAECGKCHSQIFEIVQWQEGVFMDLRNVVLLHVPGQTIQDKSLHFFNISKIVGFLFFGSYKICRFWSPAKTFCDRSFILFLE